MLKSNQLKTSLAMLAFAGLCCLGTQSHAQDPIHELDFEAGQGVGYTTTIPEYINNDWFSHGNLSDLPASEEYVLTGATGDFFSTFDTDDGGRVGFQQSLFISDIDILDYVDLSLTLSIAEDDDGTNQDWDADDFFQVYASIDDGGFFQIFGVEGADEFSTNQVPREDTNFDGIGNGTEVTDTFQDFTKSFAGSGSELDLEFRFRFSANDEDIAIDNIVLEGTFVGVPEPSAAIFLLIGGPLALVRRKR